MPRHFQLASAGHSGGGAAAGRRGDAWATIRTGDQEEDPDRSAHRFRPPRRHPRDRWLEVSIGSRFGEHASALHCETWPGASGVGNWSGQDVAC